MVDGARASIGPGEHVVLHLMQHFLQGLVNGLDVVLDLHERVLATLLGPRHRLTLLTIRADHVHRLVHSVKDGLIVNVVGFRDHVRQLFLVDFFFTLLFDLLDGFLDHTFPLFLESEIQLHIQNAKKRGIQLLVLKHVVIE